MKYFFSILIIIIISTSSFGQKKESLKYILHHISGINKIKISIEFDSISAEEVKLVIPRSAPGTYELTNYISFVESVEGHTNDGQIVEGTIGMGSFFIFRKENIFINKIIYEVDIQKMENQLLGAFASSKIRDNYLGILGYSVFGFIEGLEKNTIDLKINTERNWPIFSTLRPSLNRKFETDTYSVENFALLADAQYLLGSKVEISKLNDTKIPVYIATYTETPINRKEISRRVQLAFEGLIDYFNYIPMPYYTVVYEFLEPMSDRHDYGFSMEHLNSMTSSFDTTKAILNYDVNARIGGIVHHIGHSWIPLRSYGEGYRPFEWQTAPLIETIWLNEGFIWYISFYDVLEVESILDYFREILDSAPEYIKEKSLRDLSLLGSTQYSADFRIGKNLFSRGALLAYEIDMRIQEKTNGSRSFKDALLGLLDWTKVNNRSFQYNEIELIISESVGVDISDIWEKWQKPMSINKE